METKITEKKILILEDSITQALLLKDTLEKHGFLVTQAKDGLDGLEKISAVLPEIIITDIQMPRMDGYEFCKIIKQDKNYKYIPVIILTNLIDPLDVIKAMESGADSFLTKPYTPGILLSTIENALKNNKFKNDLLTERLSFYFAGNFHSFEVNQVQIAELLLSTYSNAIQKNKELDIAYTNLNIAYKEVEERNIKLKELNEQKNQFLGMAAHDLKNPLSVILGFSSLLLENKESKLEEEKIKLMLQRIYDYCFFMINVVDDLLDYSSIEAGSLNLKLQETDLIEVIQKDLILYENLAKKKDIKIKFIYPPNMPKIITDSNKVSQILNNLIGNAIKFSFSNSEIELSLSDNEKEVLICIKDKGIGMSEEMLNNLFQPFNKKHSKGTSGEKGFGLGLAITHKIVQAFQGKIWAESKENIGTTFYITIPFKREK